MDLLAKLKLLHFAKVNLPLKQGRKLMGGSGKSSTKINKMPPKIKWAKKLILLWLLRLK